jgi:ADP-heptose:LPS heptosyltransferase
MKTVLIRQRPSIGDCLLLGPLIGQLKTRFTKNNITVITDAGYMSGALPRIFQGISGVDRIECIDPHDWTTASNQQIDGLPPRLCLPIPPTVKSADLVIDCNAAFIQFERDHGGKPPYGIAHFWLVYYDMYDHSVDLLPHYNVSNESREAVTLWLKDNNPHNKPMVGVVMRSGGNTGARDWDFDGMSSKVADWLHTNGYLPVGIDATKRLQNTRAVSCVGKPIDFVAALIERCKIILTPDTGMLHLAQAVGTPQVALWGIMSPELRTKNYNCVVVPKTSLGYCPNTSEGQRSCQCHWKFQQWSCLRRITLQMIVAGLEESLS